MVSLFIIKLWKKILANTLKQAIKKSKNIFYIKKYNM